MQLGISYALQNLLQEPLRKFTHEEMQQLEAENLDLLNKLQEQEVKLCELRN